MEKKEVCPKCGKLDNLWALSRKDNKTMICDNCGTREALEEFNEYMKNSEK